MKNVIAIALAVLVGFAVVSYFRGSAAQAPTPAVFAKGTTLSKAIDESRKSGKPVYAVVTASWCSWCQKLKGEALADPTVAAWIEANTIPVMIDADAQRDDAIKLGANGLPASFILKDGKVVASHEGYMPTKDYLAFLKSGVPEG
ncbi:MAG: thioredoxin family protein [Phycisphaeraceae bacterium]|nr:MAG: thioredoxin family protein [Phycisphaeraceae bacterium]